MKYVWIAVALLVVALFVWPLIPVSAQVYYNGQPRGTIQLQSGDVVLDSSGNATWTYPQPFSTPPSVSHMAQMADTINPLICNYVSVTTTAATVHCWRTSLLGLLGGLFGGNVTGQTVTLTARAPY